MSNDKVFQSLGAATMKAREAEDNFVCGTTSKCSSAEREDLFGLLSISSELRCRGSPE